MGVKGSVAPVTAKNLGVDDSLMISILIGN